jgi:hypothetical protein
LLYDQKNMQALYACFTAQMGGFYPLLQVRHPFSRPCARSFKILADGVFREREILSRRTLAACRLPREKGAFDGLAPSQGAQQASS